MAKELVYTPASSDSRKALGTALELKSPNKVSHDASRAKSEETLRSSDTKMIASLVLNHVRLGGGGGRRREYVAIATPESCTLFQDGMQQTLDNTEIWQASKDSGGREIHGYRYGARWSLHAAIETQGKCSLQSGMT